MPIDFVAVMKTPPGLERAKAIAVIAHAGQFRKFGDEEPYVKHPERVAEIQPTNIQQIIGWLHDVLEDTEWTAEDLLRCEFDPGVVEAILALTRRKDENYLDYMLRVRANGLAQEVKAADLLDNITDLKEGSMKDKYRLSYWMLTGRSPE
jgi:(p)ppGpp synthase/HD superfamily hydrolase